MRVLLVTVLAGATGGWLVSSPLYSSSRVNAAAAVPFLGNKEGVLYQANWKSGLGGWKILGAAGWSTSGGMLTYNGNFAVDSVAPFQPASVQNYAIEASVEMLKSRRDQGGNGFGLVAHQDSGEESGVFAGYLYKRGGNASGKGARLHWMTGTVTQYVGGSPFSAGAGFHTYRYEVRGDTYRMLRDGKEVIPSTVVGGFSANTRIGIWSSFAHVRFASFRVLSLTRGGGHADDTGPLLTRMIASGSSGVSPCTSTGLRQTLGYFRANKEFGHFYHFPPAFLKRKGRLLSYSAFFQAGVIPIFASLSRFSSGPGARWEEQFRSNYDRKSLPYKPYKTLSVGPIGSRTRAVSFPVPVKDIGGDPNSKEKVTDVRVYFVEGHYSATVNVSSKSSSGAEQTATCLAKGLDQHIVAVGP